MLSFLGRLGKKSDATKTNPNDSANEGVIVVAATEVTTGTKKTEYALVGFEINERFLTRHLPEASLGNAVVAVNFASSITSGVGNLMSNEAPTPMSRTQFITTTLSWGLSVGAQLLKYFENFSKLQTAQHDAIRFLPMDQIDSCYIETKDGQTITLEGEFTPEAIIKFTQQHGKVTIQFTTPGVKLELFDFGIFTKRVGGTAAVASLTTGATQMINVGYFLAEQANIITPAQAASLQMAADVTTNIPLIGLVSKLGSICNDYTGNFIRQQETIITELYVKPKKLHELPLGLLDVAGRYMSEAHRQENLRRMDGFIRDRDVEAGNSTITRRRLAQNVN